MRYLEQLQKPRLDPPDIVNVKRKVKGPTVPLKFFESCSERLNGLGDSIFDIFLSSRGPEVRKGSSSEDFFFFHFLHTLSDPSRSFYFLYSHSSDLFYSLFSQEVEVWN